MFYLFVRKERNFVELIVCIFNDNHSQIKGNHVLHDLHLYTYVSDLSIHCLICLLQNVNKKKYLAQF